MKDVDQIKVLQQGTAKWNKWRMEHPEVIVPKLERIQFNNAELRGINFDRASLKKASLIGADLRNSYLNGADLREAHLKLTRFNNCDLTEANIRNSYLNGADLRRANLYKADLSGASLCGAHLNGANLSGANFSGADLFEADLSRSNLDRTNFTGANLAKADIQYTNCVQTNFNDAILSDCLIYGISAWDLEGTPKNQTNLIITPDHKAQITVDDLEVAQFVYLLLNNKKIRNIIDTITSKVVLILGRFNKQHKNTLDKIREELRFSNFTPILFDFDKPLSKDITGTIETLARMARFIIADLTDPSSIPHELATIVPFMRTTPIVPIRLKGSSGYSMFEDFSNSYKWVLKIYEYKDDSSLIKALPKVISPAIRMSDKLKN